MYNKYIIDSNYINYNQQLKIKKILLSYISESNNTIDIYQIINKIIIFFDLYQIDTKTSINIINSELHENELYEYIGYQDGSNHSFNVGLYKICKIFLNR